MANFVKTKMNLATVTKEDDKRLQEKDKFFKEGVYDCVITAVEESKLTPKDIRWKAINLTVEAPGDKKTYATVEVPTEDTDYIVNGKNWFFKFNEFREFAVALGMLDDDDMLAFITNKVLNLEALKGQTVKVKMGWQRGVHAKYISEGVFNLVDEKDMPMLSSEGGAMKFPNKDACEVYSKQKNLYYKPFVRPIGYLAPNKPVAAPVVEKKKKVAASDMPF